MLIVLMGSPAAGKGEQASRLAERMGFVKKCSGDALREQRRLGTELGQQVGIYMDAGKLVPDDLVIEALQGMEELAGQDVILDGFPRTVAQAKALDTALHLGLVIFINVPEEVVRQRILTRMTCSQCGQIFNPDSLPADKKTCSQCGGQIESRTDDRSEDAFAKRMDEYRELTLSVIEFYRRTDRLREIDGNRPIEEIYLEVAALVEAAKS